MTITMHARYVVAFCVVLMLIAVAILPTITFGQSGLENPLKFKTIQEFIAGALKALVAIALPILALFIVYSGFLFVMARGNSEQLSTARRNFAYVIIGGLLILGAWVLAELIGNTVSQIVG